MKLYLKKLQAYLGDIAGSVKITAIKRISHEFFGFPVHIEVMFTLHCSLSVQ
jgi:hypothetical protein